ncbi:hypothetical protein RA20_01005 [Leisingera sp. ANG-Vp]|nr:hypothetical protein RA20_01005 [Leisingera sp. ANG-Vp]
MVPSYSQFELFSRDFNMRDNLVYFDTCGAIGKGNGVIQIELVTKFLDGQPDNSVSERHEVTGNLRCSIRAAEKLVDALQRAIALQKVPQFEVRVAHKN